MLFVLGFQELSSDRILTGRDFSGADDDQTRSCCVGTYAFTIISTEAVQAQMNTVMCRDVKVLKLKNASLLAAFGGVQHCLP